MPRVTIRGSTPCEDLVRAIYVAAEVLGIWECYSHEGRYHFALGGGWSIALSAGTAGRIQVETCRLTRPVDTMWALAHHQDRLAGLIKTMSTVPQAA